MEHDVPRIGEKLHGFTVVSVRPLDEYAGTGIRLRHDATGLDAYHLYTDDRENLFAFAFKTPPTDNTGAAHIVEHTVLSGSRRYPIKDPFLALMKGSMNTFLNAMTYPDKTVYPASTTVEKDYFHLMSVYADAVFFPLLKRELFRQEGYRLVPQENGDYTVDGVVFNEMKGNYSSFESIVGEWSYRSVFSDSVYRFDSGGEPQEIPRLSYEQFVEYHRRYYHPSNCRLFLYGNIPTERQLEFLQQEYLKEFGPGEPVEDIGRQTRWAEPKRFHVPAPSGDEGEERSPEAESAGEPSGERAGTAATSKAATAEAGKSTVIVNWLTEPATDPLALLTVQVLSDILIGHPGTPLYKAVVDSGIGEDVSPSSGLESDIAEPVFSIGVRGTGEEREEEFEQVVLGELERLVGEGIPEQLARGALNRVEFRNREIKGGAPFGLRLMGKALRGWLHGEEPENTLEFTRHMEELKRRYEEVPGYFEDYIRRLFLENPHRSTVTVEPKPSYLDELQESIDESVQSHPDLEGEEGKLRIREDLERFARFQSTPDSREDIERIPVLSKEDLPEDISTIETGQDLLASVPLYTHRLYTNGIAYIDIAFNLKGLSEEDSKLLPLLGKMISSSGIPGHPYDDVARMLAVTTGGLFHSLEASPVVGRPDEAFVLLLFRLKSLYQHIDEGLDLAGAILTESHVDDTSRLKEVLSELRNDLRSAVIPSGHSFASLRAGSHLRSVIKIEERWRGIEQLEFLSGIGEEGGMSIEELAGRLRELRERIITRERMLLNITAEEEHFEEVRKATEGAVALFPAGAGAGGGIDSGEPGSLSRATIVLSPQPHERTGNDLSDSGPSVNIQTGTEQGTVPVEEPLRWESLLVPAAVGYSSMVLPAATYGEDAHPLQVLLAQLLKTDYLWEKVRMQGGAYGAAASAHALEGVFGFLSYRDPDVGRSLGVFEQAFADFAAQEPDSQELEKAVIAVVGKDARPKSPGEKSIVGLRRLLYGITDESRREKRRRMLEARPEDISAQAKLLYPELVRAVRVVLASERTAAKAEEAYPAIRDKLRTRVRL